MRARGAGLALLAWLALTAPALGAPTTSPAPDPWGCDAHRPAVAYVAGGAGRADSSRIACRYDTGQPAAEPSFAFDRAGRILHQNWIFQSTPSGEPARVQVRRSDASLTSWSDVSPNRGLSHPTTLDPILLRDDRTGRIFSMDFNAVTCSELSWTDDDGATWTTAPSLSCGGFDGESIGAGPPVTSTPIGYPDLVYYCTGTTLGSSPPTTTPICTKSLDGGQTFVPTGAPPYPLTGQNDVFAPYAGSPVVGPDGTVYVPKRLNGQPQIAISHDEGASWKDVQVASDGSGGAATRVAVDGRGDLAYTWVEGLHHHAMVAVSRDRGLTWSKPVDITPPGVTETALPRVDLSSDGSLIAIAYLASTNAPGHAPFFADCSVFLSECTDGAYAKVTWNGYLSTISGSPDQHSLIRTITMNSSAHPLLQGGCSADGACKADFDFVDVHLRKGEAYGAFVDDCSLRRPFTPAFNAGAGICEDGYGEGDILRMRTVTTTRAPSPSASPTTGPRPESGKPLASTGGPGAVALGGFGLLGLIGLVLRRARRRTG